MKTSILWLEKYLKAKRSSVKLDALEQWQLSSVLGISRQSLTAWLREGMPRRSNGMYDLKVVCRWLPGHYQRRSERWFKERLTAIEKKLKRNLAQCQRFLASEK